jgi:hypothetical protein
MYRQQGLQGFHCLAPLILNPVMPTCISSNLLFLNGWRILMACHKAVGLVFLFQYC